MRTEAQINASRLNGAKSRGPVTAEGKATSSLNALKHGILAATVLIDGESEQAFHELVTDLYQEFQPATPFEESLIETMIVARWRLERIWNVERTSLNIQMAREKEMNPALQNQPALANSVAFKRLGDDSRSLDLILRYESRHDRQYLRAHKRFLEVRKARLASGEPEPPTAKPPAQVIPIDRTPTNPEPPPEVGGAPAISTPVSSTPEIESISAERTQPEPVEQTILPSADPNSTLDHIPEPIIPGIPGHE